MLVSFIFQSPVSASELLNITDMLLAKAFQQGLLDLANKNKFEFQINNEVVCPMRYFVGSCLSHAIFRWNFQQQHVFLHCHHSIPHSNPHWALSTGSGAPGGMPGEEVELNRLIKSKGQRKKILDKSVLNVPVVKKEEGCSSKD